MTVQEFITKARVPKHLKGCKYIEKAIEWKLHEPNMTTEDVYAAIADEYAVSVYAIAGAIRKAIFDAYGLMDKSFKNELALHGQKPPGNGKFISIAAYMIQK